MEMLTGSTNKKKRNDILLRLKAGEIDVLVGTHALYGNGVCAECLSFVSEELRWGGPSSMFVNLSFLSLFRCRVFAVRAGSGG